MSDPTITESDKAFIEFWEKNREKERKWLYQLIVGLPIGIIFVSPVLVNFLLGRFWYKRADSVGVSQFNPMVLVVAAVLIIVFMALFNKKHKWDLNEQRYQELKSRMNKSTSK